MPLPPLPEGFTPVESGALPPLPEGFEAVAQEDPTDRAYRLLNEPDPALVDYVRGASGYRQAYPDTELRQGGPEVEAVLSEGGPALGASLRQAPPESMLDRFMSLFIHPGRKTDESSARSVVNMAIAEKAGISPSMLERPATEDLAAGWQGSVSGLLARGRMPDAAGLPPEAAEHMPLSNRLAHQVGALAGDMPFMAAGMVLGGGPETPAGWGGSFGLPAGLRKVLVDQYERGEAKSWDEFKFRLGRAVWETAKGEAVGMATRGVGEAAAVAGPLVAVPAEVSSMVGVAAALDGRVPEPEEFLDAALVLGGMKGISAIRPGAMEVNVSGKLGDIYVRAGKRPAEVVADAKADPSIAEDVLSVNKAVPDAYAQIAREQEALARGYDRVKADPLAGSKDDILATITPEDIEAKLVMLRGPALEKDGQIVVQGRELKRQEGSRSGYGMVKIIWKHGEMSAEGPETQVSRDDVVNLPRTVREFIPAEQEPGHFVWRVPREDGNALIISAKGDLSAEGIPIVTMHVESSQSGPLSTKREGPESSPPALYLGERYTPGDFNFVPGGPGDQQTAVKENISTPEGEGKGSGDIRYSNPSQQAPTSVPIPADKPALPEGQARAEDAARISDVVSSLEDKLLVPIRTGRMGGQGQASGVLGLYKVKPEVVRVKVANDMATVAHEVGHHVEKVVFGDDANAAFKGFEAELLPIATGETPTLSEGFAEFMSKYVVDPEGAKALAPRFFAHFEQAMDQRAPEVKAALLEAREGVRRWAEQPALMEVLSHVSVGEGGKLPWWKRLGEKETWHQVYTGLVDDLHPLKRVVDAMVQGRDLPASQDPYVLARMFRGWAGKANEFLDGSGPFSFWGHDVVGKPLRAILAPVESMDELRGFLVARRAVELEARGINSGVRPEAAARVVSELGWKYGEVAKELDAFQDNVLNYLADSGVLSREAVAAMREANKAYVPFFRVMEDAQGGGIGGGLKVRNPVKRIKGSGRDIIDPLESIIKNTYTLVNMAERNAVGEALVRLAERTEGMGKFVEEVPTPMQATKVGHDEIVRSMLKEWIPKEQIDALLDGATLDTTIFRPSNFLDAAHEIAVWRDGARRVYQVHPDIAKVMNGLGREDIPLLAKIVSKPASWLRAGATLTPDFIFRNAVRDPFSAFVYSKYGFVPGIDFVQGLFHAIRKDDVYHAWQRSGAAHAMFVSLDRQYLQKGLADLTESGVLDRVRNLVRHPMEALRIASELAEQATRLGEFANGLGKEGQSKPGETRAGYSAREVTLDFARVGLHMRAANAMVAFTNARIQGLDKMVRAFKDDPVRTTVRSAAAITLPSLLLALANHQWASEDEVRAIEDKKARGVTLTPSEEGVLMRQAIKDLPQWQKDLCWIIPAGGILWRIPKPFELGVLFGTIPERILEWALDNHQGKDARHAFEGLATTLWEGIKPGIYPNILVPFAENDRNRSFLTDRPIVPASHEKWLPEYQYASMTTEATKKMSEMLGAVPALREMADYSGLLSPAKVENIVSGWTGGLGRYMLRGADWGLRKAGIVPDPVRPEGTLADIPAIGAFVSRWPSMNTEPINRFQQNLALAQQYQATAQGLQKEFRFDDAAKLLGANSHLVGMEQMGQAMSNMRTFAAQINSNPAMPADEKRQLLDRLYLQMNQVARAGNAVFDQVQDMVRGARTAPPTLPPSPEPTPQPKPAPPARDTGMLRVGP